MNNSYKNISRREFIKLSTLLASAPFTNEALAKLLSAESRIDSKALPKSALNDLQKSLNGNLITPSDSNFGSISLPNNLVYSKINPLGIALCQNEADVASCLSWCSKHNIKLIARNGGHSYAGFSTTQGLMINLQALNSISYDKSSEIVRIGAGASNGQIYDALESVNRTLTHGRCLQVGVGAFLLGGGVGFNMRRFGVGSDQMTQTEMILANGISIRANQTENTDLFWACRGGGGGNFGINTSFNIAVHPADSIITFMINWSNVSDQFIKNLFEVLESAPRELGHQIYFRPEFINGKNSAISAYMFGQYAGSIEQLNDILRQINSIQKASSSEIKELPYWKGARFLSERGNPAYYRYRSRFINSKIPDSIIPLLRNHLGQWKNEYGNGLIKFYQMGGAVNDMRPEETAFTHRNSEWLADIGINWKSDQIANSIYSAHLWQDLFYNDLTVLAAGGGAYQNFVDRSLQDWGRAYYGENLARLESIKQEVDPNNLFKFLQSIHPRRVK